MAIIKPDDLVRTPDARTAVVVEIQPAGRRLIEYVDGARERAVLFVGELVLVRAATPAPWKDHSPPEERIVGRGRIQKLG